MLRIVNTEIVSLEPADSRVCTRDAAQKTSEIVASDDCVRRVRGSCFDAGETIALGEVCSGPIKQFWINGATIGWFGRVVRHRRGQACCQRPGRFGVLRQAVQLAVQASPIRRALPKLRPSTAPAPWEHRQGKAALRFLMKFSIQLRFDLLSISNTVSILEVFGVERARSTVHNWVHEAELQPRSRRNPDHVAAHETVIRFNDE